MLLQCEVLACPWLTWTPRRVNDVDTCAGREEREIAEIAVGMRSPGSGEEGTAMGCHTLGMVAVVYALTAA